LKEIDQRISHIMVYTLTVIVGIILGSSILTSEWIGSSDIHSTIEISSSIIAIAVGVISIFTYRTNGNTFYLFVGLGFFISGGEDFVHGLLSFKRLWPNSSQLLTDFIPATYVTGRLLLGIFVIIGTLFTKTDLKIVNKMSYIVIPLGIITGGVLTVIAFYSPLPQMVNASNIISRPADFVSSIVFITAFALVFTRLSKENSLFIHYLLLSLLVNAIGQFYMSFSKQLFDACFDFAHIMNIVSYILPVFGLAFQLVAQMKTIEKSTNEIKSINKKLNNYSFTISHDLKEPIRSVRTFSQFILEDYSESFDDEGKDYLQRIIRASKRMANMIDDLLALSKVSRTDIAFTKVDFDTLLSELVDELAPLRDSTNSMVTFKNMPIIECHKVWITSVFQNLITNAIKYSDKEKTVVEIDCKERKHDFEFTISDNGMGIEQDQFKKIFGLFRRATTDKLREGSGAGLAIVAAIIEQHNGEIWVDESTVGIGTKIKFTIEKGLKNETS